MVKLRQFGLLLWKNLIIQRRKVLVTVLEIGLPCLFAFILVSIRQDVKATLHSNATEWRDFTADEIPNNLTRANWMSPWRLAWTPSNNLTDRIIASASKRLRVQYEGLGFGNEEAMVDFLTGANGTANNVIGGVVFSSLDPGHVVYKIRLPSLARGSSRMSFFGDQSWQTTNMFPLFESVGPRNKDLIYGGSPGYWQQGFLAIQQAVDRTLLQYVAPKFDQSAVSLKFRRQPYPPYEDDQFVLVIQKQFTLIVMLSFIFLAQNVVKCVVHEKERKLKESMKMMGLANYLHWSAWFVHSMLMATISLALMTIFVCVQFGPQGKVISHTDPSIVFVFLVVYAMSTVAFGFAVSTIFSKANTGAAAAGILFFLTYIPYSIIQPRYHTMSFGGKIAACLINNVGMALGGQVIGMFEGTGAGVQWSTIHHGASVDDNLSLLMVMLMLLGDTALYLVFTWYVEAVYPGDYGVAQPWYFPVLRGYWCGRKATVLEVDAASCTDKYTAVGDEDGPAEQEHDEYFERYPIGVNAGVVVKELRKVFVLGPRRLVAVKGTSVNFYEGQITALLGHNGAGKTTTMAMLTGFIPPTSGTALVNGYDIRHEIDSVRTSLGLCPQHDVLFDELTVKEHLQFFCKLKGFPSARIDQEVERMLYAVGLYEKRNMYSATLSGGMKRKLSVAIALVADSKVVILDEPTSGMDPNARRQTWELLQKERAGRTMVLSTHYMDEADHLGDRIAIMAEGVVKCYGSSLFLKKKYGAGYHMVIVKQAKCNVNDITNLILSYAEGACMESNIGADLSYILPHENSHQFEAMFTEIERLKEDLGILSYGVSVTTMEEVFLRVGASADPDLYSRLRFGSQADDSSMTESQIDIPSTVMSSMGQLTSSNEKATPTSADFNTGFFLYLQQLYALFVKRALYTWRNRLVTITQLAIPLVFTIAALAIIKTMPTPGDSPPLVLNISSYKLNVAVMNTDVLPNALNEKLSMFYSDYLKEFADTTVIDVNKVPTYADDPDIERYFLERGVESVSRYSSHYLIGASFENDETNVNDDKATIVAHFNDQAFHTPAITLNAVTNALLRYFSMASATLTTVNHPLPRTPQEEIDDELDEILIGFTISFNVVSGMAFLSSSFILYLIKERSTKSKHCQFVSGARASAFWLANFAWDYINYMIPCLCLFVVFAGFNIEAYTGDDRLGLLLLLFIVYGWAMLPFMYLTSFLFSVPATGYVWMTMFNIVSGIATVLAVEILSIPQLKTEAISRSLEWFFLTILPNFCFGQALEELYINYEYLRLCNTTEVQEICELAPFLVNFTFPCCQGYCEPTCFYFEEDYLSWKQGGIGRMLCFLAIQGFLFFTVLFLIESQIFHRFRFWLLGRGARLASGSQTYDTIAQQESAAVPEDGDVAAERERVLADDHNDPLVLNEVSKYYDSVLAVDRLSLGISHAECFGLLGINGAGKTTTFKMLTGDEPITKGKAYICGYNVQKDTEKVRRRIGYCPQYDALVDHMTGRELITLYAHLRGIRGGLIKDVVNHLLFALTLDGHADKLAAFYSGGNKRKLSTALALVGEPYIVFLDEPTSGMDPLARRLLWDALSRYRNRGKTLILTSHSMEECEALCTRMGIMVNGQFRCLGSQQHLKTKFGEGYTLMVRVAYVQNRAPDVKPLMDYIQATFPDSVLKDLHQNLLHYHIPATNISWARIFGKIERVKDKLNIEDYSVSQTTLEQVFINFARAQMAPRQVKQSCCNRVFCCCCDRPPRDD